MLPKHVYTSGTSGYKLYIKTLHRKGYSMLNLRQGKAKNLLENSINSALTAVETYNRPGSKFRLENYIVLMIIAWTKLFHAYFQSTIGEKYFYKEKNGHYKIIDGDKKAWELSECIKNYQKICDQADVLSNAVVANLKLFIGIRNKIEHRYWDGTTLDIILFGECQALLYNFENCIIRLFGNDYAINTCLAYALQFSHLRSKEQLISQRELLSKDMQDIKRYIDKYKTDLPQDVYDSQEYSIKLLQIPKVSNTNRSDLSVEYVNWNTLCEEDKEAYKKISIIIKDKKIVQNVSNNNMLKPSHVVEAVKTQVGIDMKTYHHTCLWKAFKIRPASDSKDKFETVDKYCVYDEPHDDYLYTMEWCSFVIKLFTKHGFTLDNLVAKCGTTLTLKDYE